MFEIENFVLNIVFLFCNKFTVVTAMLFVNNERKVKNIDLHGLFRIFFFIKMFIIKFLF